MINTTNDITQKLKQEGSLLGFDAIGIAPVGDMKIEYDSMRNWLSLGMHGNMKYLERAFEKRMNPVKILPNAKSVIVTLTNYFPNKLQSNDTFQIAKHAYGQDYHDIIRKKITDLQNFLLHIYGVHGKVLIDSSSIFEKAWAQRAGLGWIGKNSLLINKQFGSYCNIGILLVDIALDYDLPNTNCECGDCSICIELCPTNAIAAPRIIDARKCISYLTIENKDDLVPAYKQKLGNRIYGCDTCQDVCPYNQKPIIAKNVDFHPNEKFLSLSKRDWKDLSEVEYNSVFSNTSIQRAGYSKLKTNIQFLNE